MLLLIQKYEGVSINNQPIPFSIDRDGHDFHALFQYMFYTWVQSCTRIESFFNKILKMSNMASDAKVCFSTKVEYRVVIRYLYLKVKTGNEIQFQLADIYGSSAPSYAQVKLWVVEFKRGRTSLEDEARSGRPLDATDKEMCKKVRDLVYSDKRIQVEEIAQALGISHGSVSTILHDRLGMRKLTVRWVPKSLSDEQMTTRTSVCSALLKRFRSKDDFLLRLVTVDETWVHYYEPENKAQSSVGRAWVPEAKEVHLLVR